MRHPRFHPPQESAVLARRFFRVPRSPGIFDFRDVHRRAAAVSFSRPILEVLHVMLGV